MLRIAICDDNPQAVAQMQAFAAQYAAQHGIQVHCEVFLHAADFLDRMAQGMQIDACCLDILMPAFSGIDVAARLRMFDKDLPILFCTSSPEYALQSYRVQATAYLLKPVQEAELFAAFDAILRRKQHENTHYLMLKNGNVLQKVVLDDILFVEVSGRSITYQLTNQTIVCTGIFASVVAQLRPYPNFAMPNRSVLINLDHVLAVSSTEIRMENQKVFRFSPRKLAEFKQTFLAYMMQSDNAPVNGQ